MFNRRGFTIIELIIVIVILSILALVALPRFLDLRADALNATRAGIEGAVAGGAMIWKAKYLLGDASFTTEYPPTWSEAVDPDSTADMAGYTITYSSTSGHATVTGGP